MKVILLLLILILPACTQSSANNELFWDYSSFKDEPKISLKQAHAVCNGPATHAANNQTRVQTSPYPNNPLAGLVVNNMNQQNKQNTYNNIYKSCMAQHGWDAYLASRVTTPRQSSFTKKTITKGTDAAVQACIEAHGTRIVTCKVKDKKIKKEFCDCRVNGGFPQ